MVNLIQAKEQFAAYCKGYDTQDERVALKRAGTAGSTACCTTCTDIYAKANRCIKKRLSCLPRSKAFSVSVRIWRM